MRRIGVMIVFLAVVGAAAFGQLRIDAGVAVPIGIGAVLDGSSLEMNNLVGEFLARTLLPLAS